MAVCAGFLLIVTSSFSHLAITMQGLFPMPARKTAQVDGEKVCVVEDPEISEASGLALCRTHEHCVWMHNDSGDTARLFLVDMNGTTKAIVSLRETQPRDWEDMCSFEADGQKWLLVGDTGDNGRVRGQSAVPCQLLLIREPDLSSKSASEKVISENVDVFRRIELHYPDGPADCESLAVDTERKEILLLTKTDPMNCQLYRIPLVLESGPSKVEAESVAKLAVPYATSMDISADGRQLAIVNMFSGALLTREKAETWHDACGKPAVVFMLPARPQGETVCFDNTGKSLFVNSEGKKQPLWRVTVP